jgi:hypothetical protein
LIEIAVLILICIGVIHSYLGEKYILMRLFRRENIPHLLGSDHFTKGTLRFCWHIMSFAAFGFAAILSNKSNLDKFNLTVIGVVFLLSGLLSIFFTKGKHLSWLAFFAVAIICIVEAYAV